MPRNAHWRATPNFFALHLILIRSLTATHWQVRYQVGSGLSNENILLEHITLNSFHYPTHVLFFFLSFTTTAQDTKMQVNNPTTVVHSAENMCLSLTKSQKCDQILSNLTSNVEKLHIGTKDRTELSLGDSFITSTISRHLIPSASTQIAFRAIFYASADQNCRARASTPCVLC